MRKLLLIIIVLLAASSAMALCKSGTAGSRVCYVKGSTAADSSGNASQGDDTSTGDDKAHPLRYLPCVPGATSAITMAAGDQYIFPGGDNMLSGAGATRFRDYADCSARVGTVAKYIKVGASDSTYYVGASFSNFHLDFARTTCGGTGAFNDTCLKMANYWEVFYPSFDNWLFTTNTATTEIVLDGRGVIWHNPIVKQWWHPYPLGLRTRSTGIFRSSVMVRLSFKSQAALAVRELRPRRGITLLEVQRQTARSRGRRLTLT
jgi:hypothetical protein